MEEIETWDLYDMNRTRLLLTMIRGQHQPAGTYHLLVNIWTLNDQNEILLTLRSREKPNYPGVWETTAGSALSGETSLQAAIRELHEETGLTSNPTALTQLGSLKEPTAFIDFYLNRVLGRPAITLQPHETIDSRWVTITEFEALLTAGQLATPFKRRYTFLKHILPLS